MTAKRMLGAVVIPFVVATLAYAQTGEKPKPPASHAKPAAGGAQSKAAAGKLGTPADEAAVRALVDQYQQAFNAGDAKKAVSVYAEHAVFVDETGKTWEGKPEIEKGLTGEGSSGNRPRLTLTTEAVRFIKPDVALMRGKSAMEVSNPPPGGGSGHWAVVAMKIAGEWKVVAAQAAVDFSPPGRGR